jgi:hypothetical protein
MHSRQGSTAVVRPLNSVVRPHGENSATVTTVILPADRIVDWDSFHAVCSATFGFPPFYGQNMDAWIDCLSYLRDDDGMCAVKLRPSDHELVICVQGFDSLRTRLPEIAEGLVDCVGFVNRRYEEAGETIRLRLHQA